MGLSSLRNLLEPLALPFHFHTCKKGTAENAKVLTWLLKAWLASKRIPGRLIDGSAITDALFIDMVTAMMPVQAMNNWRIVFPFPDISSSRANLTDFRPWSNVQNRKSSSEFDTDDSLPTALSLVKPLHWPDTVFYIATWHSSCIQYVSHARPIILLAGTKAKLDVAFIQSHHFTCLLWETLGLALAQSEMWTLFQRL